MMAESILDELVASNIILPVKHNDISQVEAWKVHQLMFQTILLDSADENFLVTGDMLQSRRSNRIRRLAIHTHTRHLERLLNAIDLPFVHSLSIFGTENRIPLEKFEGLRVLDVQGWRKLDNDDLLHICKMPLLRYLGLRDTRVTKIPPEIGNLRCLETLDLRQTPVTELPKQVGRLHRLFHLLVGNHQDQSNASRIRVCQLLPGDLEILSALPSLQHLLLGLDFFPEQELESLLSAKKRQKYFDAIMIMINEY
uniref:Disease resistance R13L4/SHOC-2-like LRR domain-containing protein n=1 Tax=Oryza nivara TaxID=4536 RepID=A0A0E0J4C9_ORYNI